VRRFFSWYQGNPDLATRLAAGAYVAIYRSMPTEVLLRDLEEGLRAQQVRLAFPRVNAGEGENGTIEMKRDPLSVGETFRAEKLGIEEPPAHLPRVKPEDIALVIVPGVAFDPTGNRIGMGKGHYDRYLATIPADAVRVALALEAQIVEAVPTESWDQPVDWVFTESRAFEGPGR